ncbi:MAG: hypothetical protein ACOX52_15590 [Verrucomicrobiota bacterium]
MSSSTSAAARAACWHVSRLGLENPAFKVREMQKQFPVNSTVQGRDP